MRAPDRSRMFGTATAATLAAAALLAPINPAGPIDPAEPVRTEFSMRLTGFDSPLSELLLSVRAVNNDLFNGRDVFGDYPWQPFQGMIPEFIYTALPVISQLGYNGAEYIRGSVDALTAAGLILSEAAADLPVAVVTALRQAASGHIADALETLTDAIVVPIRTAGTVALDAGAAVLSTALGNIGAVVSVVPGILGGLAATAIGSAKAVIGAAATIVRNAVTALAGSDIAGSDIAGAWNVVVDGLLGPVGSDGLVSSSIPGTVAAVTIGPGLGPLGYPSGYAVPSFRMWAERSQLTVADAVGADYPVTGRAVALAPNRGRVARAAESVKTESAQPSSRRTTHVPRSDSGPRTRATVRNPS